LLASLDVARMQMATQGRDLLSHTLELARETRVRLRAIEGISCIGPEQVGRPGIAGYDETRLVITVAELGYTGYEASEILRTRHDVQIELADLRNIVALVTIGDRRADLEQLVNAVAALATASHSHERGAARVRRQQRQPSDGLDKIPEQVVTPREAFLADHVEIAFSDSAGHVCAEVVTPYPPGIPVLCPGERITQETIDYLRLEIDAGVHIQGPADEKLRMIRVLAAGERPDRSKRP